MSFKKIYLLHDYKKPQLLKKVTKKMLLLHNIKIGKNVQIGNGLCIGNNVQIGNDIYIGSYVKIGNDVKIDNDVSLEIHVKIGNGVKIANDVSIENNVYIGNNAEICGYITIDSNVSLNDNISIENSIRSYKYIFYANYYYDLNIKQWYIRMGCFTFTLNKWLNNFWNNEEQFPNDKNNEKSISRIAIFNMMYQLICLQNKEIEFKPIEFEK